METTQKKKPHGCLKALAIGIIALFVLALIGSLLPDTASEQSSGTDSAKQETVTKIGEILNTDMFEIYASDVSRMKQVNTGNQFSNLKPEPGIDYLVILATFKNIDNESRMIFPGSVFIEYNGKSYEFDKSETVFAEGFNVIMEQINPLTSVTSKIVYKIPSEIKGPAYWQPGRADSDQRIYLGEL